MSVIVKFDVPTDQIEFTLSADGSMQPMRLAVEEGKLVLFASVGHWREGRRRKHFRLVPTSGQPRGEYVDTAYVDGKALHLFTFDL